MKHCVHPLQRISAHKHAHERMYSTLTCTLLLIFAMSDWLTYRPGGCSQPRELYNFHVRVHVHVHVYETCTCTMYVGNTGIL